MNHRGAREWPIPGTRLVVPDPPLRQSREPEVDWHDRLKARDEALEALRQRYQCDHAKVQVRARISTNSATHMIRQCLRCGIAVGQAISKADALRFTSAEPPPFDAGLNKRWWEEYNAEIEKITQSSGSRREYTRASFLHRYDEYLQSPEWKARRALVIERAAGLCEGCRLRPPTQVHHRTYRHVGREFIFELAAVCDDCHEVLHDEPPMEEP